MVLTDSTTTGHASISLISTWRRKSWDIFHKKSTHVCPTPNILLTEVCVTVTFQLPCGNQSSRSHHNGLTGQLCFILDTVSPSKSLRWLLYVSESPHQSNNFSTAKLPFCSSDIIWIAACSL